MSDGARPKGARPGFDFFEAGELVGPTLGASEVVDLLAEHFALDARVEQIGSHQDQNFIVRDHADAEIAILKISNPAFSDAETAGQDEAAEAVAAAEPGLRAATVLRDAAGAPLARTLPTSQGRLKLRLLRFLPGGTLTGSAYLSPVAVARMGELAAATSIALRSFDHPGLDRVLQWNLLHAKRVVDLLACHHPDAGRRERVRDAASAAWVAVAAVAGELPVQPGHFDITDDNVVCDPETGLPDGLIDFGDISRSWAVAEIAVTISSVLHHAGSEPHTVLPAVRAFHQRRPLSVAEARALWPLVVLRGAVLVVSGEHQLAVDGDNDYVAAGIEREWRVFEQATSIPVPVMTALLCDALGLDESGADAAPARADDTFSLGSLVPDFDGRVETLDLSVVADAADNGAWLEEGLAERAARARLVDGAAAVVTRFGAARVDATRALSPVSPATVATGIDVWFVTPTTLTCPVEGLVTATGTTIVIRHGGGELVLDGLHSRLASGDLVAAGAELGIADRLRVQLRAAGAPEVPALVRPEYAAGWLAHVTDPSPLIGSDPGSGLDPGLAPDLDLGTMPGSATDRPSSAASLLERRTHSVAEVQEHYYARPPRIERGWRQHLVDVDGRAYLDMVNNVTALGHAHPRIASAVSRQVRRLNTNSRFHYGAIVEFSERLAATLPEPLDTVFLVNSGSEAVDLALRLSMAATGRRDVVSVREAYHGWTYASDAVSTSITDNPNALQTRPDWVHQVDAPNSFRGRHRGADAARYAPEAASVIAGLVAAGRPPAAFLAESFYGNAGGIALPDGYLDTVYDAVRAAGGLAIADEVQVGYGRLGEWFWGFEQQGVVPDIVTVAKAMGNGHPLGAVITSRSVADTYRTQGYFFSSTGGSPLSSVVGLTVLDVIRDERLQENAREVGGHLKRLLNGLGKRHPLLAAVHGTGLYLGVEFVRDRATLEPATQETAAICDRLLELGVVMQPTGDHLNVLKVKPPLCIDRESAEFFVAALDRALDELGH
ncbi:aminotransferase [Streptomyces montanus]|uniref:Aminotransferase n=1 Tax=Streptomyces montanus TaxID=2580423 RepID=A0A5R9FHZ2_9ACTN|nr:aminotransferase [Streptomyces montanus]TLS42159.1 aminotransferase [Streptomyces montanus]